ncbi:MAG: DUF4328 domain-containing protein [Pyrinomonadaceae bacterium]
MTHEFRSPGVLATLAMAGLGLTALCELAAMFVGFGQIVQPDSALDLGDAGPMSLWLMLQSLIALVQVPIYIATVVFFLMWLYRAHSNLSVLRPTNLQFTPGWTVGWWFIPFANLVKPFQAVREVWWESSPDVDDEPVFLSASLHSAPVYMGLWWAFWIISNVLSNINARVFDPEDMTTVTLSGYLFILTGVTSAIAAGLAIYVVKDTTDRQGQRALAVAQLSRNEPPPPPTFRDGFVTET